MRAVRLWRIIAKACSLLTSHFLLFFTDSWSLNPDTWIPLLLYIYSEMTKLALIVDNFFVSDWGTMRKILKKNWKNWPFLPFGTLSPVSMPETTTDEAQHFSPFTTHFSLFTIYLSPFTSHHSLFTIYFSPFTIHYSPFTSHHLPFTIYHSLLTIYYSLFNVV